ncbi:MAG: hypothetical protein IKZ87_00885 [Actinomycetaceae bacterium]|nr:hypothetical protein [Actinomycetaceae bacterium]
MFSKKVAGIGAAAALAGSALVPSIAFAAPGNDSTPAPDKQAGVNIVKTIDTNSEINVAGNQYTFNIAQDPCQNGTPATDTACAAAADYPTVASSVSVTFNQGDTTKTVAFPLPDISATPAPYSKPGIYVWKVTEQANTVSGHDVTYSQAGYRVKAYVVKNASTGALEYKAVTIAQDTDDAGTAVTTNNKREQLDFKNVYKDVANLVVDKTVVNNAGLPEDANGEYSFTVAITYPSNFTPTTAPTVTGAVAGSVSGDTAGTTSLSFKLKNGDSATIAGLPVGTTYTVTETNTGTTFTTDMKTTKTSSFTTPNATENTDANKRVTASAALGDGGNVVDVTNTYEDITPTGLVLEVLPYVLMIGIPLLAIAGYIALRRKMNL